MQRTRSFLSLALATAIVAASGCAGPGQVIDTWETRSPVATLRVLKRDDYFPFGYSRANTNFSLDVYDTQSHEWRAVLKWRVDGDSPILREKVRFVTNSIVYAFGNAKYVITTDAGKTWSEWDAEKAIPDPEAYAIEKVLVADDGTGSMVVRRRTRENDGLAELATADYGVHWTLKNEGPRER